MLAQPRRIRPLRSDPPDTHAAGAHHHPPQATAEAVRALDLDALKTERNAALAEAALWQRRTLAMQKQLDQTRAELRAANASHAEWERAYDDLLQQFRRLEVKANAHRFDYECAEFYIQCIQGKNKNAELVTAAEAT